MWTTVRTHSDRKPCMKPHGPSSFNDVTVFPLNSTILLRISGNTSFMNDPMGLVVVVVVVMVEWAAEMRIPTAGEYHMEGIAVRVRRSSKLEMMDSTTQTCNESGLGRGDSPRVEIDTSAPFGSVEEAFLLCD
ncbi:hypothetical protein V2J09_015295 [Rumex salicifolius]